MSLVEQEHTKDPSSLQCQCIEALTSSDTLPIDRVISLPMANLAQRLFELTRKKSLILIAIKKTFVDGYYERLIACGYHLAKREFLFGHFAGIIVKNPHARIRWSRSLKMKEAIRAVTNHQRSIGPKRDDLCLFENAIRRSEENKFLLYCIGRWLAKYRSQLRLKNADVRKIAKIKRVRLETHTFGRTTFIEEML